MLSLPGTNDQPGDYRGSGCTACHVVYANDRSPEHSGPYAQFGHLGKSASGDPTTPKTETGHPIRHTFTRSIPSSQCMVCHIHPGTNMETTYFGYTWWDNEADGEVMYPKQQRNPSAQERYEVAQRNPEGAAPRGLWADQKFLEQVGSPQFNGQLKQTPVCRFSRARLDISCGVQARPHRGICSTRITKSSHPTTRTNSERPSTLRTSIWKKECSAWIAISSRTSTATGSFTPNLARRSSSTARTATGPWKSAPR